MKPNLDKYIKLLLIFLIIILFIHSFGKFFLNDGDHGRDLISFLMTSKGQMPFIDYKWIYGPLMPFYYAVLFKIFSPDVLVASVGWYMLFATAIILFYILASDLFSPLISALITLLFVVYHGFYYHTFNHIGGTLSIIAIMLFFIRYIRLDKKVFIYLTSLCLIILGLIKFNMFLAVFPGCFIALFIRSKKQLISFSIITLLPLLVVYSVFIFCLPSHNLYDIFPYGSKFLMSGTKDFFSNMISPLYIAPSIVEYNNPLIILQYKIYYSHLIYYLALFISAIALYTFRKDKDRFIVLLFLTVTSLLTSHEFLMYQVDYSLKYWMLPVIIISATFALVNMLELYDKAQKILFVTLTYIAIFGYVINILIFSADFTLIDSPRARVSIYPASYANYVYSVSDYLLKNTAPEDKVLAIPYNSLFLFLADRQNSSSINEFLYISGLDEAKEQTVINDLITSNTQIILLSNMSSDIKTGTGEFGKTHAQLLSNFIYKNYSPIMIIPEFYDQKQNIAYGKVITFFKKNPNN